MCRDAVEQATDPGRFQVPSDVSITQCNRAQCGPSMRLDEASSADGDTVPMCPSTAATNGDAADAKQSCHFAAQPALLGGVLATGPRRHSALFLLPEGVQADERECVSKRIAFPACETAQTPVTLCALQKPGWLAQAMQRASRLLSIQQAADDLVPRLS